ncbi:MULTISPECIES: cobaltochelatase subunit CobN [unclassified Pseudoalteromonas]|uniref:cobaltochelatase subunit CobN n=1 Tax=unclassified Pseudoalteromonas TaxID=194690 RepID=UPI00110A7623|nr:MULTISPECIES: cobaltochelatase subunit CobN [unclassified Pseudoalteromonas]TMP44797.1 cobaltochelatase subunit CobN [Pseudoalteromonas sp. S1650]TMP68496.1 cobaltochelatase subunit CobN [Pseudoalteromonas sp. S1649]
MIRIITYALLLFSALTSHAAQKPEVLIMMSGHVAKSKGALLTSLAEDQPFTFTNFSTKGKTDEEIKQAWQNAELILLDGINPALSKYMFAKYQPYLTEYPNVPVISLGDMENSAMNSGLSEQQHTHLGGYYNNAGRDNYRNMMLYIANAIFKLSDVPAEPVKVIPNVGLYHPEFDGHVSADEMQFFNWLDAKPAQPVIAIAIHRSVIDYEQQQIVDALITGLQNKGAKALAFFFEGNDEALTYPELLSDETGSRVDLIINYRSLHYVEKRRAEFMQIGVPVIHALNYTEGDEQAFKEDHAGVSPALTPFFLVMPEDTGSTDPIIIAANEKGSKVAMQAQLNALVERAFNHANLAHIKNTDKKVATFIWNYPPGEKNIGAAFLDVPSSIANIAKAMNEKGYQVKQTDTATLVEQAGKLLRPYYRGEDAEALVKLGLADYLPLSIYQTWFDSLPQDVTQPIIDKYGQPSESGMLRMHNGEMMFVIPRMELGNMIVLPQGVRGETAKQHAAQYHSTKSVINHSYLAIYLYARDVFNADAVVHLGTHGSQEWLSGKERGLSVYDAPNLAIGNIPVFYPYIIDNVGEAMQAKRRGRATMISHLTPGFAKAGLYTEVAKLNELITNYLMLDEGQTKSNTQQEIIKLAKQLNMLKDLDLDEATLAAQFADKITVLQDHLNTLAQMSQPLGVHIFGELPINAHLYSTILQMLGDDFTKQAGEFEREIGIAIGESEREDERKVVKLEALEGFQLLARVLGENSNLAIPESLQSDIATAKEYWQNFHKSEEITGLLNGLNGQYIPVSHGNDPIRNPAAVPTGRNLIGFNPAKVPSKEAYQAGVKMLEQTVQQYQAEHGRYPQKLAFSLWSLETMRHQGALEAQILHAMGIKPKWNNQGNIVGTEVIPYSELGRPRIDVVVSATGLYRDAFPNVMLWIAEAIDKVAKMKEDNNFVYRHSMTLKQTLLDEGKSEEDADYLSSVRIFSNESGAYGTGLAGGALDSDSWENDSKLANLYLDRMGFGFGKDEARWSENLSETGLYKKVLSGTDGVVFSRSSNLYALMTNDDPFQYFGGIGLAVRNIDGKTPQMYVSNLRRKGQEKIQTLDQFISNEMRSRYFHPRWIKAMQDSGYAGATAILDRMNNMWGWEVMTPDAVRDDQWQEFFEVYVDDKYDMQMREFFEQHNAEALAQIIERMLEAVRKGYWQADAETLKKMLETYTEIANQHDVVTDNEIFTEFVKEQNAGFGLAPLVPGQAAPELANSVSSASQQVSGQKLEQVEQGKQTESDYTLWWLLGGIFFTGMISPFIRVKQ